MFSKGLKRIVLHAPENLPTLAVSCRLFLNNIYQTSFGVSSNFPFVFTCAHDPSVPYDVVTNKVNFSLNVGQFRIDLADGEVLYHSTQPLKGMTLGDCIPLLHAW